MVDKAEYNPTRIDNRKEFDLNQAIIYADTQRIKDIQWTIEEETTIPNFISNVELYNKSQLR